MSLNARLEPVLYLFAGLFGVAGVALAALAAHGGGEATLAASASAMCLAHAPALLALALGTAKLKTAWLAGFLMIVGTLRSRHAALFRFRPLPLCRADRRLGDDARLAGCGGGSCVSGQSLESPLLPSGPQRGEEGGGGTGIP
ncbi:hypothetical protein AMJ97_CH03349 [Rhizobium sp. N1314]|nr:hypothetical protein AMK02_CH03351 [Rhizobium sp. N731]ANL17144.1 hypothetical protein AMJ97_CH03349 [Rhizobium sp. N1314]